MQCRKIIQNPKDYFVLSEALDEAEKDIGGKYILSLFKAHSVFLQGKTLFFSSSKLSGNDTFNR